MRVFLCGPGVGGTNYHIREFARETLLGLRNVEVHYGEDIEKQARFQRRRRDLQTLELEFAHSVDFTLLLLESPGSIAELGTFSMVDNIRGRLIVLVPSQFYRDSSYITRGPLSLISHKFQSNIIYFDRKTDRELANHILYPATFYKYAHYKLGYRYQDHIENAFRQRDYELTAYETFMADVRREYAIAVTLIGIMILGSPTFPELIASTSLSPNQTSYALRQLYRAHKIRKDASGRYQPLVGYGDQIFDAFSTTSISEARAELIAALDSQAVS